MCCPCQELHGGPGHDHATAQSSAGLIYTPMVNGSVGFARSPPTHQGLDRKKEQKKKPAKTMKEKRAAKNEKKVTGKSFAPT